MHRIPEITKIVKTLMPFSEEESGGAHKITVYVKYTGEGSGSPLVEVTSCVFVLWMYLYFVWNSVFAFLVFLLASLSGKRGQ